MEDCGVAKWFIHMEGCLGFPIAHTCSYHHGKSGPETVSVQKSWAMPRPVQSSLSHCPASVACVPCCDLLLCWGVQAPTWSLCVDTTPLLAECLLGPHGYGERICECMGWAWVTSAHGGGREREHFSLGIILAWVCDEPGAFSKWAINFPSFWGLLICPPPT